jgi:hypothetical protein
MGLAGGLATNGLLGGGGSVTIGATQSSGTLLSTPAGSDLAFQQTASASNAGVNPAANAFDGSDTTQWQASFQSGADQWIQVDLGSAQTITSGRILPSSFGGESSPVALQWGTTSTGPWTTVATGNTTGSNAAAGSAWAPSFAGVSARYWRVFYTSVQNNCICWTFSLYSTSNNINMGTVLYGAGAPGSGLGSNGYVYIRTDGAAGTMIYKNTSGTWAAII